MIVSFFCSLLWWHFGFNYPNVFPILNFLSVVRPHFTTIDISTQATSHVLPGPVLYQYQYPYPPLVWGPALPAAVYGGAAVPPDDVITEDGLKLELLVTR